MNPLERRYRRLLSWYPAEHRERYEQEMLGVLLDGAEPGRSRPTLRESVDLVRGAIAYRARIGLADLTTSPWRRTAGLVAVVAVAAAAALSVSDLLAVAGPWIGYGIVDPPPTGPTVWAPPVVWCLALLATLAARRRVAVGFAGLGVLLDLGVVGLQAYRTHGFADLSLWRMTLPGLTIVGLLWTRDLRDALRLIGWRRGVAVAVLLSWHTGGPYALAALPLRISEQIWDWTVFRFGPLELAVLVVTALAIRLERPVRLRLFATVAVVGPVGVLEILVGGGYPGGRYLSLLIQLAALMVVTVGGFTLAAAAVRGRERVSGGG